MIENLLKSQNESLFVLSSAVNTRFGVFTPEQRFDQTIHTCQTILKYAPKAEIFIAESGESFYTKEQMERLSAYVIGIADYTNNESVKSVIKVENWDVVKNMIEMIVFRDVFRKLSDIKIQTKFKRIFKFSGRYFLNDKFDYDRHLSLQASGKFSIKGPYNSQFKEELTGTRYQYMSRLYSFDSNMVPFVTRLYDMMLKNMVDTVNSGRYIDIEHSLYKFIPEQFIDKIETLGVEGILAPNGSKVDE